ncbi:MAG: sensor domain-containing diguanylate cyclase [Clostridia bacterium]|nr:sensor domain-containing diguanylate cyclase [Clostridia bacterium]
MQNSGYRRIASISFIFVLISIVLSTVLAMYSMRRMNILLAARIHDKINNDLTEPIMAAKTMANNAFLYSFLEDEDSVGDEEACVEEMKYYLKNLKSGLKYDSVFVVSEKTHRYYTDNGLNKIVDPENDPHDIWYSLFLEKNKEYDLDVDSDEVNNNVWTVFVNARVESKGELLGACGVGVKMTNLQDLLYGYEKEYGVKVNLIDSKCLVQVDTDEINIENSYLDAIPISAKDSNEYIYNQGKKEFSVSKYIENLGWYLVIQSTNNRLNDEFSVVIILNGGLFIIMVMAFFFANHVTRRHTSLLLSSSYVDELTGLQNRRAYEENISALTKNVLPNDFVFVTADVNGLKEVNDNLGHSAGDELIRSAAECLNSTFGNFGDVYRIGGDEFSAILHISDDELEKAYSGLLEKTGNWHGKMIDEISVSVGYVPRWEAHDMSLSEMIQEADIRMYKAKKIYYSQKGRDRRVTRD